MCSRAARASVDWVEPGSAAVYAAMDREARSSPRPGIRCTGFEPLAPFLQLRACMSRPIGLCVFTLLLALAAAGCQDTTDSRPGGPRDVVVTPGAQDDPADQPEPRDPAPAMPDDQSHRDLVLERPSAGQTVSSNPLVVRGRARTFENNVFIRIVDSRGNLMTTAVTTARGDMGNLNPFETEVWLTRDPGSHLVVELVEHSAKDGSVRALTRRQVPFSGELRDETLWFAVENPGNDCSRVLPVNRRIPATQGRIRALIEALLAGPTEAEMNEYGVTSPFPEGARVQGVNLSGALAVVDFNERMANVGGSCRVAAIRSSVEQTLTNLADVDRVEIRANGSADLALQP